MITNVPYLARGKQEETLRRLLPSNTLPQRTILPPCFLSAAWSCATEGGTVSLVLPQNWLFLSYRKLREKLLKTETWHSASPGWDQEPLRQSAAKSLRRSCSLELR